MQCFYGYNFPMKYSEVVAEASQKYDLPQEIIFSVINVESHFNPNAVSSKGAVGLMQIMPSTAEEVAKKANFDTFELTNPRDNIMLGSSYLATLNRRFENLSTAICAYNAGPTNVSAWLKNTQYSSDGKTLKKIPFEETRNYLAKFNKNLKYYRTRV